jgi:16S rRNA A1518/A1519 N6-dimethyltransferase RsmA/KsgA/DIM1 with predicted DNA glycosylase/AP lyase activity
MPLILDALHIRNNQTIIDLGAGDGIVIFEAATEAYRKKLNTQFYADEINPILLAIMWIRRLFHPNRHNIHLIARDMFIMNFGQLPTRATDITFYIYISPWFIEKTIHNIQKQVPNFSLVSYYYQVKNLPHHREKKTEGIHKIYSYT